MSQNGRKDVLAEKDQQLAAWLDGLADVLACARDLYWRGEMSNVTWQENLDTVLNEMRRGARILRSRPIATEARR